LEQAVQWRAEADEGRRRPSTGVERLEQAVQWHAEADEGRRRPSTGVERLGQAVQWRAEADEGRRRPSTGGRGWNRPCSVGGWRSATCRWDWSTTAVSSLSSPSTTCRTTSPTNRCENSRSIVRWIRSDRRHSSSSSFICSINIKQSYTAMQYSGAGQQGPRKDTDTNCDYLSWHSTTSTRSPTPTPTRPTRLQSYVRHTLFPLEDPHEDVRVGVVECRLYCTEMQHEWAGKYASCIAGCPLAK